jgi:uncharacterized linocin/CFP29 family protein
MMDFLMRDDAPLTASEWETLDEVVVSVARRLLVGRRLIELAGPFGVGTEVVRLDTVEGGGACTHEEGGGTCEEGEADVARVASRRFVPLPLIHKDFVLSWRDLEAARQRGLALELGPAAAAASAVARAEDELVFAALGGAEGALAVPLGDWMASGNALNDTAAAAAALAGAGFVGPYTLVAGPDVYAMLQRPFKASGRLESKLVARIADGGILRAPALGNGRALMVARGAHYIDLAVGQDIITAYLGPEGMDHRFRVLESVALRIKQPGAICLIS